MQEEFEHLWINNNGKLNDNAMIALLSYSEWRMYYESRLSGANLTKELLQTYLSYGPVYIGFYDQAISSPHVNIIYGMKGTGTNTQVSVMEPRFKEVADGMFEGKHLTRTLSHYQATGCTLFIACPKP